jgi:hypothetical protein
MSLSRGGGERRGAGLFRVCPACGARAFVGRLACPRCGGPLDEGQVEGSVPEARGRRAADSVFGRRGLVVLSALAVLLASAAVFVARGALHGGVRGHTASSEPAAGAGAAAPLPDVGDEPVAPPGAGDPRALDRGRRLLEGGRAAEAVRVLSRAVAASPNDALAAHLYGLALHRSGSRDRGLFQLERAARLAPGVASYRLELARTLAASGRQAEARRHLEAVLRVDPGNAAARQALRPEEAPAGADAGVDLGGAPGPREPGAPGSSFTDEDLRRYRSPASPRPPPASAPSPPAGPSPLPAAPTPGPGASPQGGGAPRPRW